MLKSEIQQIFGGLCVNTFLSTAQQALKEQFEIFARNQVAPLVNDLEGRKGDSQQIWQKLSQPGYLGLTVAKEYGGAAAPFLHAVLLAEALGEHNPGLVLAISEHLAAIELLQRYGSAKQKSRYLPLLARGECIGALGFTEDSAGSDFSRASAVCAANGQGLAITGRKVWVVNGGVAGLCIASARMGSTDGPLHLYLVNLDKKDSAKIGPNREKMGLRSAETNDIEFVKHQVDPDALLETGAESTDEQILHAQGVAKVIVAAGALGLLESAIASSVGHANARVQFGEKVGQFQGIQWKLADMSADTAAARMLVYRAACGKDEDPASFRKDAAMCKWYATKVARVQSAEAVQIHGAQGITAEHPVERAYRDAKVMEICEGTAEFQKVLLAQELGV